MSEIYEKKLALYASFVLAIGILVWIDQYTKALAETKLAYGPVVLIKGVFEFYYIVNTGTVASAFSGQALILGLVSALICIALIVLLVMVPKSKRYSWLIFADILLISGAIGNIIDRFSLHYVRDFLYFKLINFPIFNMADSYATVGMTILAILILFVYKEEDLENIKNRHKDA